MENNCEKKITFSQSFVLPIENESLNRSFNRYTLTYYSSGPIKGSITYMTAGEKVEDEFFLEAGEQVFTCLIKGYLKSEKADKVISITLTSCTSQEIEFTLHGISFDVYDVLSNDTFFVENGRFKVGLRLIWGGGICYIEDNQSPIEGLTNMINQADEGRLVQQSYYGTGGNDEYQPGRFNNQRWVYNPVQGGDRHANHSRLIDIKVEKDRVYVKSQPQDWSKDGDITPTYMENTYILTDEYIRVDNRFVDFSGWKHHYEGINSWTGDEVTARPDLPFWGDPACNKYCCFSVRKENTETWCSWTCDEDDYGIGLYVPNIDLLLAGKHEYNKSKDPYNAACNYVAPIKALKLVSYEPVEYSYLITCGSVKKIRETFTKYKDFATNESLNKNCSCIRK